MSQLSVGFARVNINPMRGIGLAGYFLVRNSEGILDDLEVTAVALENGSERALVISLDLLQIQTPIANAYRKAISEATGVPYSAIFMHCTHTHTAPYVDPARAGFVGDTNPQAARLIEEYQLFVGRRLVDVSLDALADLAPAKMGYAVGRASNIAFIRRFRMKDGSVRTNPGVNNPDIVAPIGELDERVSVVRFDREGATSVAIVNFGNHPDVVGGCKISGDWPAFTRRTVEKALDNVSCIFLNGAQGDVNHVNVHPTGGYLNDLFMDFDDVARGYNHAKYMGRVVTGAVLQVWDKVKYVEANEIRCVEKLVKLPSNMPTPEQVPEAHRINDLHLAGRDAELPYEGMMLTTVVAEAGRMVRLEHGPAFFEMPMIGLAVGDIALVGIPGEPFNAIGRGIKKGEGFELIMPCCLVNGSEGYFPMKDAYDEGGYEARSSNYKAGTAEQIIEEGLAILAELRK